MCDWRSGFSLIIKSNVKSWCVSEKCNFILRFFVLPTSLEAEIRFMRRCRDGKTTYGVSEWRMIEERKGETDGDKKTHFPFPLSLWLYISLVSSIPSLFPNAKWEKNQFSFVSTVCFCVFLSLPAELKLFTVHASFMQSVDRLMWWTNNRARKVNYHQKVRKSAQKSK